MTTAQQTSSKAKREQIFRTYMNMCTRQGYTAEHAVYSIAADLGVEVETVMESLNRTVVGR